MNPLLKQKIINRLRIYLNREPSNDEVINGQNDANLMQWIAHDDVAAQQTQIETIAQATATSITPL